MTIFSLVLAFLLEQLQPLDAARFVRAPLSAVAEFLQSRFNDGQALHGTVAWLLAVLPPVAAAGAIYLVLLDWQPLAALAWNVVVLYLTMGFRSLSRAYSDIHAALRGGDLPQARSLIGRWRGRLADGASSNEIARLAIEEGLVASHRHVFAVIFWFLLLPGPTGPLLYRLSESFAQEWGGREGAEFGAFGQFAQRAFALIDWLPARVTAAAFAIVGDFEDAIYCWRSQAERWPDRSSGILLASGAGAIGVRLGMPVYESGEITERPELGLGDDADADFMQSTVGLVWRTLVLFLLLLALFWVATWVGQ
jgi:adenosylcobinamide-phosphate synthase